MLIATGGTIWALAYVRLERIADDCRDQADGVCTQREATGAYRRENIEGLGIRFVASPRHADLLLVTGPVSRHMAVALRRTYEATPSPKLVVAVGDCGCTGGVFGESYASCGRVSNVIPVDVTVPGCPPPPADILAGILAAVRTRPPARPADEAAPDFVPDFN